jgi:superoxide reductase
MSIGEVFKSADWKTEKHVPVIDAPASSKKGEKVKVTVSVGKEIPHPNTTAHHIVWIELYFLPEGEKNPYFIGKYDFASHGASTEGADTSSVYSEPEATVSLKTEKSGTLIATSYCNIHGLWESKADLKVS